MWKPFWNISSPSLIFSFDFFSVLYIVPHSFYQAVSVQFLSPPNGCHLVLPRRYAYWMAKITLIIPNHWLFRNHLSVFNRVSFKKGANFLNYSPEISWYCWHRFIRFKACRTRISHFEENSKKRSVISVYLNWKPVLILDSFSLDWLNQKKNFFGNSEVISENMIRRFFLRSSNQLNGLPKMWKYCMILWLDGQWFHLREPLRCPVWAFGWNNQNLTFFSFSCLGQLMLTKLFANMLLNALRLWLIMK